MHHDLKNRFLIGVVGYVLSQSIFVWAKNTSLKSPNKIKSEAQAQMAMELAPIPLPEFSTVCEKTIDCRIVEPPCGGVGAVNSQYESEIKKTYTLEGTRVDCVQMSGTAKKVFKPECRKNTCEVMGAQELALKSNDLWKQKCPIFETINKIDALEVDLRALVQKLEVPIGSVRKKALSDLAKMGEKAAPTLPWIIDQFKNRNSINADCFFGEQPESIDYIEALGAIEKGEHPALPILIEWLKDEKNHYRHAEILKLLVQMGPRAVGALPILISVADKASDTNWSDERGDLAIDALVMIGADSKKALPSFEKWVGSSKRHKVKLLKAMILIDPSSLNTQRSALACAKQGDDIDGRTLALNYLIAYPKEMVRDIGWIKNSLTDSKYISNRIELLRLVGRLGNSAQALVPDLAALITQNQDDLRRLSALILRDLDADGSGSAEILKKRVYSGFAFESQYAWKLMGSQKAQVELLKSYVYYVVGKRFQFTEVKVAPDNEAKLVQCLVSADCSNKTSAVAALQLLNSSHPDRYKNLVAAMDSPEASLRWDAATSLLLWVGMNPNLGRNAKDISRALQLQKEAMETGGYVRHLDLEDILIATKSWDESVRLWLSKMVLKPDGSNNNEVIDAVLVLANRGDVAAQKVMFDVARQGDKQRILTVIQRLSVSRISLGNWVSDFFKQINLGEDSAFQDLIWQKQLALMLPAN